MPVLQRGVDAMSDVTFDPIGRVELSVPWGEFAAQAPELAEFGAVRLGAVPAYLATVSTVNRSGCSPAGPRATHRTTGTCSSSCASPTLDATATATSLSPSRGRGTSRHNGCVWTRLMVDGLRFVSSAG